MRTRPRILRNRDPKPKESDPSTSPGNCKLPFGTKNESCFELSTLPIQCLPNPIDVPRLRNGKTEVPDLQRSQFERLKTSVGRVQVGKIHQHQVVTVALVTTNPLIVVQKITAAYRMRRSR